MSMGFCPAEAMQNGVVLSMTRFNLHFPLTKTESQSKPTIKY